MEISIKVANYIGTGSMLWSVVCDTTREQESVLADNIGDAIITYSKKHPYNSEEDLIVDCIGLVYNL